jgi:hypothetical protein
MLFDAKSLRRLVITSESSFGQFEMPALCVRRLGFSSNHRPKLQGCYIERRRIPKYLGSGRLEGDLLDKPVDHGGLAFSRYSASGILAALIIVCILFPPQNQKAGSHPGQDQRAS